MVVFFLIVFILTICVFIFTGNLLLLFFLSALVVLDQLLDKFFKFRLELRIFFYLLIFFIGLEFMSGQGSNMAGIKMLSYVAEAGILLTIIGFALVRNKNWYSKEFKTLTLILISFIVCNFFSTILNYQSIGIFLSSTFDYCKYFSLIYFIMLSKFDDNDILKLLKFFSPLIIICTALSVLQFIGLEQFFDLFRGRFEIKYRDGNYRSIGFFPYPIELGNYSAVLFSVYYYLNIYKYKELWFSFISLLLVINVLLSGTRMALVALGLVFIFSNLKSIRQVVSTMIIVIATTLIINNFIDIEQIIDDTKAEYVYTDTSPREYYFTKGIDVWKDNALFGIGFATYGSMKYRSQTDDIIYNEYHIHGFDFAKLQTTDSFIAQILPEFGTLGILILLLFGRFIFNRYKQLVKIDKSNRAYINVFLTTCILSLNSSSPFFSPHVGTLFWISIGMILNNYLLLKKMKKGN